MRFKTNIRYDFVSNRKKFYTFSTLLVVLGILSLLIFRLNLGIDFSAGTTMDVNVESTQLTNESVDEVLNQFDYSVSKTIGGTDNERVSLRFGEVLDNTQVKEVQNAFITKFGEQTHFENNVVTADIARESATNTIWAIVLASLLIMIYVMIRFEWRFAVAANLAILYDCFVVVAAFSIFRFEVDLPFIAAVLTTLGYSINDKIVIFDRIRENLRFNSPKGEAQLAELVNASIWQTMARNMYTVLTVVIVTVFIFALGSPSIRLFSLAILIGLISGAYSTLCIASTIWFDLKRKEKKKVAAKPTP